MNFTIERNTLLKPLGHIYSIVERRNTIPILSNVLIETNSSKVSFTATDMDMDIVETARCIVSTQGKVTVSAHTLYDIVRKLTDGSEISIKLTDTNLEVSAGKSKFILPTLPVDDYPIMTEIEKLRKEQMILMSPQRKDEKLIKMYEILPEGIQEIDKTDTQGFNKSNFRKVTLNGGIIEIINQIQNEIQKSNITEHDKNKIIEKVKDLKNRLEI